MAKSTSTHQRSRCTNCGYESDDRGSWDAVETPTLGELTRCPECGSTKVTVLS